MQAGPSSAGSARGASEISPAATRRRPPGIGRLRGRALRLAASGALLAGLLASVPAGQARDVSNPSLDVTFFLNGTISVTLPDGTPVGSTSGAPTVIPAGYYTLLLSGPGACSQLPLFDLSGPGEHLNDDMSGGEVNTEVYTAYFAPSSTYTWRIDNVDPAVVHTFVTSATVVGSPTGSVSSATTTTSSGTLPAPTSQDVVGSAIVPFRGTLTGTVSAAGSLTLAYKGKSVTSLMPGRYTITVSDRSATSGFLLEKLAHAAMSLTGVEFVGKRSVSVDLTAGRWLVTPRLAAKKTYAIVVG